MKKLFYYIIIYIKIILYLIILFLKQSKQMSVFKDKTPIMCTKGATRDLYSNLMVHKRAITNKANKKSEDYDILRERFKPISKKLKDITNAKKPH